MENKCILCVVLILGIFTPNSAIEIPENLRAHADRLHTKCQAETGVEDAILEQSTNGVLPNDRKLQCYIYCLFQKTGLIDENNIIHLEHIMEVLPAEVHGIIENLVSTCGTKHGADPCETAYLTVQCYFDADPMHAMLI